MSALWPRLKSSTPMFHSCCRGVTASKHAALPIIRIQGQVESTAASPGSTLGDTRSSAAGIVLLDGALPIATAFTGQQRDGMFLTCYT